MGHGNGWPSPYTYDPHYTTKDGFGLNATAGDGDYNNKYYGEPYVATLDLAPNAIVLLHHLCYASGNSEPGDAAPTVTVARQRVDNYAAGFLKAGAVGGHRRRPRRRRRPTSGRCSRPTRRSRTCGGRSRTPNGNVVSFPSARTPGATVFQDPDTPTSGFYRSLAIGDRGVTTDEVVSAGYGDTGADPASLVVPGNAAVGDRRRRPVRRPRHRPADAGADDPAGRDAAARRRAADPDRRRRATPLVEVAGHRRPVDRRLHASPADLAAARQHARRSSASLDAGGRVLAQRRRVARHRLDLAAASPNRSPGRCASATAPARLLFTTTGTGSTFSVAWDGMVGGSPSPDGTYAVERDRRSTPGRTARPRATRALVVDTDAAGARPALTPGADTTQWFSPNGDGVRDTVSLTATNSEPGSLIVRVVNAGGDAASGRWTVPNGSAADDASPGTARTQRRRLVPDGTYTVARRAARPRRQHRAAAVERTVTRRSARSRSVDAPPALFFPQDLDTLGQDDDAVVHPDPPDDGHLDAAQRRRRRSSSPASTRSRCRPGRRPGSSTAGDADGTMLPRGRYTSIVTATRRHADRDAGGRLRHGRLPDQAVSDTTPGAARRSPSTVTSAEPLSTTPAPVHLPAGLGRLERRA